MLRRKLILGAAATAFALATAPAFADEDDVTFTENEITHDAADFFGFTTETVAKAVQHVFQTKASPTPISRATKARARSSSARATAPAG